MDRQPASRINRRTFLVRSAGLMAIAGSSTALLAACAPAAPPAPTAAPAPPPAAKPTDAPKPAAPAPAATAAPVAAAPTAAPAAAKPTAPAPAAAAPTTAPAAAAKPAGTPKPGGTSVWAAETDPVILNPITNSNFSSTQGFEHTYESLTAFDAKLNVVPSLAERWETPDPNTYIFHLRKGVKFHDGAEFSADDVKYTFDIVLDPKGPAVWRGNFDLVDKVEVVDKNTVKFVTKAPFPPLLGAFAIMRSSGILSKGAFEKGKLDTQAVGTGPYKITEYVTKSHVKLVKNAEYWGKPLPYMDEVTFKVLEDEEPRVAGLRGGSLDYAFLTPDGAQRLRGESKITVTSAPRMYLYGFNISRSRKPFSDPRVRQAISLGTNRQEYIDKVFSGSATVSGPIATGFGDWFIPPEELNAKWYRNDLEKARQLLKDAGVAPNFELELLITAFNTNFPGLAVVFADQMKRIGLNVKVRQVEQGVFTQEVGAPKFNFDVQANAFTARHDPDGYVYNGYHSQTPSANGYSNPKLDELLTKARTTIDRNERKTMYRQIQEIMLDDAPFIYIANDNVIEGLQNYVKGYTPSPFSRRDWGLKNAWLEK